MLAELDFRSISYPEMIRICIITICLDKKLITFEWDSSSKISQLSLRKLPEICNKSELSLTDKILFFALHFKILP